MEVSERAQRRRGYRRFRGLHRDRRAVVSVVGTLLALLVFFALFGIFVTQYVPIWMADNEGAFSAHIQASLAQLKYSVDEQAASGHEPSFATPFTLASDGIPLIATPTPATLNFIPHTQGVYVDVAMQYGPSGRPNFDTNLTLGTIQATLPNRYYPGQTFDYEADAVIQSQGDTNQILLYPPTFVLNSSGSQTSGTFALVQLYGNATQVVSSGTVEVYSHYGNVQQYPSNGTPALPGAPFRVTITIGTLFPCAWASYLNRSLSSAGLPAGSYTLTPSSCVPSHGVSTPVKVVLTRLNSFDFILASFTIQIGVGQA
jgi:hypothetical protein